MFCVEAVHIVLNVGGESTRSNGDTIATDFVQYTHECYKKGASRYRPASPFIPSPFRLSVSRVGGRPGPLPESWFRFFPESLAANAAKTSAYRTHAL